MKKLTVGILFLALVIVGSIYTYRSGIVFWKGFNDMKSSKNVSAGFAFAELLEHYPYSPFISIGRVYLVSKDPNSLPLLDVFFKTRPKGDAFSFLVGKSPAYYDPFFFAGGCFFLVISLLGVLKRYWAGTLGVSAQGLVFRDGYIFALCVFYFFWIRGSLEEGSIVHSIAGSVHGFLNTPLGVSLVTLGFAALMLLSNVVAILIGFIGLLPRKQQP